MADLVEDVVAVADEVFLPCFDEVSVSAPRKEDALHDDATEEHHHHNHPHCASHSELMHFGVKEQTELSLKLNKTKSCFLVRHFPFLDATNFTGKHFFALLGSLTCFEKRE